MDKDGIHGFFSVFARLVPAVAVVIILLGIAIRYHVFDNTGTTVKEMRVIPSPQTGSFTDVFKPSRAKSGFDPAKDFTCLYDDNTASVSAYKKGADVMIRHSTRLQKKMYLIKGDCLYIWKDGEYKGQKLCGIGDDLTMIQTVLSTGIVNVDSLAQAIPEDLPVPSGGSVPVGQMQKILKSCVNSEVKDGNILTIPKNVVFSEVKK